MTATLTETKVDPGVAELEAFLATGALRLRVLDLIEMRAGLGGCHYCSLLSG
jgi:hypothetical protein